MKANFVVTTFAALALLSSFTHAAPILTDSFESGNMSATNADGFKWASNNKTSVVNSTNMVWSNGALSTLKSSSSDWAPYDGSYSLRFLYPAGQYMSEQRFDLGKPYRDLWVRYWIRVPTNFTHPSSQPNNQKFLSLWMDGYSSQGAGPSVWLSFFGNGSGGSTLAFAYSVGGYTVGQAYQQYKPFISVPADRGRWMQIVFHVRAATSTTSNDGVMETWRRWSNESSFTKLHETKTADIGAPSSGPNGWKAGYLMGWANAAYSSDTEWLMDKVEFSAEPLLTATTTTPTTTSPPTAPVLQVQ